MSLQTDLLKHTIFLQRIANREKQKIIKNLKNIAHKLVLYGNPYNSLKIRNKIKTELVNSIEHDVNSVYNYERKFIKKLIKKYV